MNKTELELLEELIELTIKNILFTIHVDTPNIILDDFGSKRINEIRKELVDEKDI